MTRVMNVPGHMELDHDGNELGRLGTPASFLSGITIGPQGQLWYADPVANEIVRVDP